MVASVGRCYTNPKDYAQENYYTEGESFTNAEWLGKAANIQGLNGQIKEQDFLNAYSSLDPQGNPLRKQQQYQKSSRRYNRPGTDVTLSAPKSVSVAALVNGKQDVLEAHKAAVRATIKYVENNCIFYQTKQRGQKLLLQSEAAQIAVFHHDDNRNKDPQLHSHCVILNQTHCLDGKWRAVANKELYKQQKTIGVYYDHELARQLQQLGYQVEWTSDHTLELAGIDKEKLDAVFSTRSNQIEAELAQLGLTRSSATAQQKQAVCLKTRQEKKQHHHPQDRIEQLIRWQLRAKESGIEINEPSEYYRLEFERIYKNSDSEKNLKNLISNATFILTERFAAFSSHELLRECLRQSQGKYNPENIQTEIARSKELVTTRDGRLTTTEAIDREQKIIQLALSGKDSQISLSSVERAEAVSKSRSLNTGQTTALKQMVTSRDGVILIQGNAGVGKTYTMKAFAEIVGDEQPIRGLAPSAAAASVLQTESGISSQTLASYLLAPKEQLTQQEVILVDEASMISTRSAKQLLEKARQLNSRVILIGDTKQLSAIETGAPFKLLQSACLPTAVIDQNLRQRDPSLKQIVNSLATHDKNPDSVNEAYQKLNESGKIKQIEEDETRIKAICSDYLSRPVAVRQKTLILASTNKDKQAIASSVRRGLINEGTLGDNNLSIQTLKRKNLDKFALSLAHRYQRGDIIKFQTDSAKFSKDLYYRVTSVDPQAKTATLIDTVGITETLELNKYKQRFVYQLQELEIRKGERMRFTKNLSSVDYKQLNGQRFTVENITEDGRITISSNGKTKNVALERLLHSDYSYVDTVHSSQGQTADYCIYSAANGKSLTIGRESFYVAASRARQEFVTYTASTQDLGVTVKISRANENAKDLVNSAVAQQPVVNDAELKLPTPSTAKFQQDKPSNLSLTLTEQASTHSSNEPDQGSVRDESETERNRIGFDRIISSLTDSSRQSEELAANLRGTNSEAATTGEDQSNCNGEPEPTGNSVTENNRAAEELTREFKKLSQRARGSNRPNRETRKPSSHSDRQNPGRFIAKIKQFARDIFPDNENHKTGEIWNLQPTGRSDSHQTSRTTKGNWDYSLGDRSVDLDADPRFSPQPTDTSRNQRSSQQQRNSSQTNRESVRQVETPQPFLSPATPPKRSPNKDEINQIILTAISAIKRYGLERERKTTFNNNYYQIEKFSVFETYGYQSYLTIDALDGRGRLLTMKGQNFHPANLKITENHLTERDVFTFEKIQFALDRLQQIRQFQENAATILRLYGKRNNLPHPLYKTFEGENYRIERDEQALRITALDGRGEIFNCPSDLHTRNPEKKAVSNLNSKDVELFSNVARQIKQKQREAEQRRQKEQIQPRRQGWSFER